MAIEIKAYPKSFLCLSLTMMLGACSTITPSGNTGNISGSSTFRSPLSINTETVEIQQTVAPSITKQETRRVITTPAKVTERLIPAVTKQIQRRVVKTPSSTYERIVPAVTRQETRVITVEPQTITRTIIDDNGEPRTVEEHIPASNQTVTETVVVQEASTQLVTVPPIFETVTETVVVQEASSELVNVPAVYETVTETVVVQPELLNIKFVSPTSLSSKIQPKTRSVEAVDLDSNKTVSVLISSEPFNWDAIRDGLGNVPGEFIPPKGVTNFFIKPEFFGGGAISLKRVYSKINQLAEAESDPEFDISLLKFPRGFVILTSGERIDENGKAIKKNGKRIKLESKKSWVSQLLNSIFSSKDHRIRYTSFTIRPSIPDYSGDPVRDASALDERKGSGFKAEEMNSLNDYLNVFYLRKHDYVIEVNIHEFLREIPTDPGELERFKLDQFTSTDDALTTEQHVNGSEFLKVIYEGRQ